MTKNKLLADHVTNAHVLQKIIGNQAQEPTETAAAPAPMPKAAKTTSVYLSADQHAKLDSIARELDTNKHALLQLAVRRFISDWDNGYRPEPLFKKVYR